LREGERNPQLVQIDTEVVLEDLITVEIGFSIQQLERIERAKGQRKVDRGSHC
jgi:hypothetical protein